jgi:hypothetical protein
MLNEESWKKRKWKKSPHGGVRDGQRGRSK